jgi:hypothetical protein
MQATTVEMNPEGFESLKDQILNSRAHKDAQTKDIRDLPEEKEPAQVKTNKYLFKRGHQSLELEEDYELEFMADKKPTKLTLKELKERAAGDIAVKNRMHSLAEEKKRVQATFKEFAELSKKDALGALEFISRKAQETDSEFEYEKFLEMLADQAEQLGQMDEKDRKALELQKKLDKAEQDLSQKARERAVVLRKEEILADYPEIGDRQFGEMVHSVLENDALMEGLETEEDVMDKVQELIEETLLQKDIVAVIKDISPSHMNDTDLIFYLSDQIKQNPDWDEEDVRDILRETFGTAKAKPTTSYQNDYKRQPQNDRKEEIRTLSNKARQSSTSSGLQDPSASSYEALEAQLKEYKKNNSKTPLYAR